MHNGTMGFARIKKHIPQLKLLRKATPKQRKSILERSNTGLVNCIGECCLNVLNGNVKITKPQRKKLSRHAKTLRALSKRGIPVQKRRKILIQNGGGFLPALLAPILSLAVSLAGSLIR